MDYKAIEIKRRDGITSVVFNRPEKKNAMNPTLHREMHHALSELDQDDQTRVLVITGNGDSFCAGEDLKEYFYELKDKPGESERIRKISYEWRGRMLRLFSKPTIACVIPPVRARSNANEFTD